MNTRKITAAEDNIFEDLGFDKAEAENLKIRAELMMQVKRYIKKNNLTQKEAALRFGVDQPRISKLMAGKIELFTIDLLIQMLAKVDIKMILREAA